VTIRLERTGEEAFWQSALTKQSKGAVHQRGRRIRRFEMVSGGGELEVQNTLEQDRQEAVLSRFRRSSSAWRFVVLIHSVDSL
jgi:hypothetical protein